MKKFFAVILAILTALALVSCNVVGVSQTMYQLYAQASEAMQGADSLLMDIRMDMTMEVAGQSMTLSMAGSVAEVLRSETDIDMKMDMSTSVMGQAIDMTAYYKDGIYYMDAMGQKIKMPMPVEQALQQANAQALDFPESAVKDSSVVDTADGQEISFTLDGAALNDVLTQQMAGMDDMLSGLGDLDLTFNDVTLQAMLDKNGVLQSTTLDFSLQMSTGGEIIRADCYLLMDLVQIGGVTVTFPDDLDTYTETSY